MIPNNSGRGRSEKKTRTKPVLALISTGLLAAFLFVTAVPVSAHDSECAGLTPEEPGNVFGLETDLNAEDSGLGSCGMHEVNCYDINDNHLGWVHSACDCFFVCRDLPGHDFDRCRKYYPATAYAQSRTDCYWH